MTLAMTMTAEDQVIATELTAEDFLAALWGIRPGQSSPRLWPASIRYPFEKGVAEWLYRLWGIDGADGSRSVVSTRSAALRAAIRTGSQTGEKGGA